LRDTDDKSSSSSGSGHLSDRITSKRVKRQGSPWLLKTIVTKGHNPKAFIVWTALQDLVASTGSRLLTPTHAQLRELTGIDRSSTISRALTTLHNAGWLSCYVTHLPSSSTVLKIWMRRGYGSVREPKEARSRSVPGDNHWLGLLRIIGDTYGAASAAILVKGTPFFEEDSLTVLFKTAADASAAESVRDKLLGVAHNVLLKGLSYSVRFEVQKENT